MDSRADLDTFLDPALISQINDWDRAKVLAVADRWLAENSGSCSARCDLTNDARRLTREQWSTQQRDDVELVGVPECLPVLGIRDLRDR